MVGNLLIHGGPILTMNPAQPDAEAIGIVQGKIVAVGALADVKAELGTRYETIDLQGRMATPGLYDAHAHIFGTGVAAGEIEVNADRVSSIAEIAALVKERAANTPTGAWIVAQGYDQENLAEKRHPNRHDLDAVAPDHPVIVMRTCHHIMAVNSLALKLAGIDANTPDPDDGTIDRDEHGEPTGVLREKVMNWVRDAQPKMTDDEVLDAIITGGNIWRSYGVTSVADAGPGVPFGQAFAAFQRAHDGGTLPVRVYAMMLINDTLDELIELGMSTGFGDAWLRMGNAKLYTDGSIGGRTARMGYPYQDEESNIGLWMEEPEVMKAKMIRAHRAGFQQGHHAIGDAAIWLLLDAYEEMQRDYPVKDFRPRIEHSSILTEEMLDRIQKIGAVPIPGTTFLYDMRPVYLANLGAERVRYAYAMNTFRQRGIVAAASTDSPVSLVNPMIGIQMMMTRRDRNGDEIFPEECISLEDAIRAYTWNGAYASHSEHEKGSLEVGKLGDVTVFETDLRSVDPLSLKDVRADHTIADGKVVYSRT
ncbi:MAG: amidohydrolase [Thermomicrobiales bacterium]|nr:amidohydrolase [Thermomicrobiales bacterium]